MRFTPSSVAFCTIESMRSPRATPCNSVMSIGDSRSTASCRSTLHPLFLPLVAPERGGVFAARAVEQREGRAGFEPQHARQMLRGLRGQDQVRALPRTDRERGYGSGACELDAFARDARQQIDLIGRDHVWRHEVDVVPSGRINAPRSSAWR